MEMLSLSLSSEDIGLIFAKAEICLEEGGEVYFMERSMLHNIYKQLPENHKETICTIFPRVINLLNQTASV